MLIELLFLTGVTLTVVLELRERERVVACLMSD